MAKENLLADCTLYDDDIKYKISDQLVLKIHDIDDLAIAWIATSVDNKLTLYNIEEDENGTPIPRKDTRWLWKSGGKHGDGEINITQWILNHQNDILNTISFKEKLKKFKFFHKSKVLNLQNFEYHRIELHKKPITEFYLTIAIYDFPYDKFISAGKWSFDATLEKNSKSIWHKHDFGKSDIKNKIYGLKYLKIFKIEIKESDKDESKLQVSEVIPSSVATHISNEIKTNHNYTRKEKFFNYKSSNYKEPSQEKSKNSSIFIQILYSFEILIVFTLYILGITEKNSIKEFINSNLSFLKNWDLNLLHYFIFYNIVLLFYFFVRYKLGGRAWELVLRKKHNKELDTFMVVLGLLFSAAFGAITSFSFDGEKIYDTYYLLSVFSLYVTTNLVLLYILTVISTYAVNTLSANKIMVFILIFFVGIGIFIQEVINFEHNYKHNLKQTYIQKVIYYASK